MNLKGLLFGLATVALAVANAAGSYDVTLGQPTWVGSTQLKPGTYKLVVQGSTAVFSSGNKTLAEVPATVEKNDSKVSSTEVETSDSKIVEIRLAGTHSKLVFSPKASGDSGQSSAH